jgi:hypothetical protein
MTAAKAISPTTKVRRIARAKWRFRMRGASALLSMGKRAHGIATSQCGQSLPATILLPVGISREDACAQWLPAGQVF